jgi:hypothetical protein
MERTPPPPVHLPTTIAETENIKLTQEAAV